MTKEEYLRIRGSVSLPLMYQYYTENFDHSRHSPFLDEHSFYQLMQLWPFARHGWEKVVRYYDEKFNVVILSDKQGRIIKYL